MNKFILAFFYAIVFFVTSTVSVVHAEIETKVSTTTAVAVDGSVVVKWVSDGVREDVAILSADRKVVTHRQSLVGERSTVNVWVPADGAVFEAWVNKIKANLDGANLPAAVTNGEEASYKQANEAARAAIKLPDLEKCEIKKTPHEGYVTVRWTASGSEYLLMVFDIQKEITLYTHRNGGWMIEKRINNPTEFDQWKGLVEKVTKETKEKGK